MEVPMSQAMDADAHVGPRSALDALPAAITVTYVILGLHGVFLLAGWDMTLVGPELTPAQCFSALGLHLLRRFVKPLLD
jgi:hypothetical protein